MGHRESMAAAGAKLNPTPERWAQIKSILGSALELSPPERLIYVKHASAGDASIEAEIQSLLDASDGETTLPHIRAAVEQAASSIQFDRPDSVSELLTIALGHQYEIIREIGRGGMGAVYLAREKALERLVAIKVLRPELAHSAESRERFRREARIAANLSHPAILQLYTFGEVKGVWYFVMSYVRGESLADLLRKRNRLPWPEAHRILVELSDALACAHKYHVVHRDIKPANVLLEAETDRAVLADFGISKIFGADDPLTRSGMVVGTPEYMSPEQTMAQGDVDERSDIYSLGAVGYTMLCGRPPFTGESTAQLMYARLARDPEPIVALNPSVPEDLSYALMKCLSRDRTNRWQTATDLKAALNDVGEKADRLPEGIRDIPSFGPYAVIWFAVWASVAMLGNRSIPEIASLLVVSSLVPIGLVLHVWLMGGRGIGLKQLIRVALRPPEWWSMYWPRSLRRQSDLWTRLPLQARIFRIVGSGFFMVLAGIIVARLWIAPDPSSVMASRLIAVEVVAFVVAVLTVIMTLLWARQRNLSVEETARMLLGPTAFSSGWTTPRLTRLLSSPAGTVRPPDADDPRDFIRAIKELAPLLPQELAEFKMVVINLAAESVATLTHQSEEVEAMQRDASPAESDRLQLRIAGLGPETASEPKQRAEMRLLLQHELDLVWQIRDRLELASRQRARLFGLLRSLHSIVRDACYQSDRGATASDVVARLSTVCAELRSELEVSSA